MDVTTFDAASKFVYGLIAVLALAVIVLSFLSQIKRMRKEMREEIAKASFDAASKAREETRSEMAFNELKKSVEKVDENISKFNDKLEGIARSIGLRVDELEHGFRSIKYNLSLVKKEASVANKRIDEHKKIDHGFEHIETREYNEEGNIDWED